MTTRQSPWTIGQTVIMHLGYDLADQPGTVVEIGSGSVKVQGVDGDGNPCVRVFRIGRVRDSKTYQERYQQNFTGAYITATQEN